MPYHIIQQDGRFCVAKEGEDTPMEGGCHDNEQDAKDHMAALYAKEPDAAKSVDLEAWTGRVYRAFREAFPDSPYQLSEVYCEHVWDDHIRAHVGDKLYHIPYTIDEAGEVTFAPANEWVEIAMVETPVDDVPSETATETTPDTVVMMGDTIKALKQDGHLLHVGGYLVRFGDENHTDSSRFRDFFTAQTDFGDATKSHTWFHHTLPVEFIDKKGRRREARITREFTPAELSFDDIGVFAKGVLDERDEYERMIAGMVKSNKIGWSSGTALHLIKRTPMPNGSHRIDRWLLGDDASYTHTPAEPRNEVVSLKSLKTLKLPLAEGMQLPEATPKGQKSGDAASATAEIGRASCRERV